MRSKAVVSLLSSLLIIRSARSQSPELLVQGQTGKLYLEHTVVAKENWYSIGRLYNVDARLLAAYNHIQANKPLAIGQQLEIPLNAANFSQTGQKTPGMTLVPVYHIIQEKEWLYRISINHNKVPVTSLEKWNNTDKDHAFAGMHLIVGYLKVKTSLSALAHPAVQSPATGQAEAAATVPNSPANLPSASTAKPTSTLPSSSATTSSSTTPPAPTEVSRHAATLPSKSSGTTQPAAATPKVLTAEPAVNFNGGFFKPEYAETGKSVSGAAGVFKSTSGWQDGKYYALMNNVAVGTIVKVTDAGTGRSVYTKVLGALPDMKESAVLSIRISNAAAGELGQAEGKFQVDVRY